MTALDAYRQTVYRLAAPGSQTLDVQIGTPSASLDRALARAGARSWAFVTAANPHPRTLSLALNCRRHLALAHAVQTLPSWPSVGLGHSGGPSEHGLAVLGVSPAEALALGRRFGQLAVVHGTAGHASHLLADSLHPSMAAPTSLNTLSDSVHERLDALRDAGRDRDLRRFAVAAARTVLASAPTSAVALVDTAARVADGADAAQLSARDPLQGTATAAATIGLKHGATTAPAFLSAFSTCAPSAHAAAVQAAKMVVVHDQFAGRSVAETETTLTDLLP